TMPTTAITLQQAKQRDVRNFYFFCQHITLIPTLRSLLEQPDNVVDIVHTDFGMREGLFFSNFDDDRSRRDAIAFKKLHNARRRL
ncbi:hypothetical protein MJH54_31695, partial [Salmonella enterica subsp. enterica serovar Montevideo]|nr:hypothetical protein [Salmonella enterica subsp. enterica serovar Montevideo]